MADTAPLILTLALAADDQARFDSLRDAHFPPDRNYLAAHVTLFHHLPGASLPAICRALADAAASTASFAVGVTGLRSLGRGVAYALDSDQLVRLRRALALEWQDTLTAQDRQGFHPHITIQNKVPTEAARRLVAQLSAEFAPFEIEATGLLLWHYRGGPWDKAGAFPFINPPAAPPELRRR